MRRLLLALVVALWPFAATAQEPLVPVVVIDGKGFGHGVGMAQEGAFWMGRAGASTEQIFGQFYPGAGYGRARGPVRVPVLDAGGAPTSVILGFPDGGEVRQSGAGPAAPGFPVRVPRGGQVRIVWEGRYRVEPLFASGGPTAAPAGSPRARWELASSVRPQVPTLPPPPESTTTTSSTTTTTTTAPPPQQPPPSPAPVPGPTTTTTAPPPAEEAPGPSPGQEPPPASSTQPTSARPVVAVPEGNATVDLPVRQRRYRGVVEATAASGSLRVVNVVDVETYLKGMGEVRDPTWPPAALRAQAVAARTYAMRAMAVGGEVCDTQRCQVYLGAQAEYAAMNRAVDETREQVLVFNRSMISAVYSANGGGHSASRSEGFGVADDASAPYLRPAPYPTRDPGPWSVTVALRDVGARLGYAGTVGDVRVTGVGPSGRATEVTLDGDAGPKVVTGIAFDAALGLRSTLFTLRVEAGAAPPPPPPPEEVVVQQAPPEEAAAAVEVEIVGPTEAREPEPLPRIVGTPDPRTVGERVSMPAILAATAVLAGVAAAVWVRLLSPSRLRPSPSAPPSAGGSP